jgi:hypothetical protein
MKNHSAPEKLNQASADKSIMDDATLNASRRTFLGNALKLGAGSLLLAA